VSLQDPRAVLAQATKKIGGHLANFLKSPNIQKLQSMNHLANTMFPVQTFCNAIFWKFTLGFYHLRFFTIQLLKVEFEECHTKNMFNVERTKISNLWLCAFPLNKYYSYPRLQKLFADFFLLLLTIFVGHCGACLIYFAPQFLIFPIPLSKCEIYNSASMHYLWYVMKIL